MFTFFLSKAIPTCGATYAETDLKSRWISFHSKTNGEYAGSEDRDTSSKKESHFVAVSDSQEGSLSFRPLLQGAQGYVVRES